MTLVGLNEQLCDFKQHYLANDVYFKGGNLEYKHIIHFNELVIELESSLQLLQKILAVMFDQLLPQIMGKIVIKIYLSGILHNDIVNIEVGWIQIMGVLWT